MGVVWQAWDNILSQAVAIKFLKDDVMSDPAAVADLKKETRRNLRLTHPNIVRIHDFLQDDNHVGISMEYVNGQALTAIRVARQQPILTLDEVLGCLYQICPALDYAHQNVRVIHRDIKPSNIMVDAQGAVRITDFGIARSLSDSATHLSQTTKKISGTLPYMSPQQLMGETASVADDIYSLGATIYELLAGKPPFYTGDIPFQLHNATASPMMLRRSELGISGEPIPPQWQTAVSDCLDKDPDQRPKSAGDLLQRLVTQSPPHLGFSATATTMGQALPTRVAAMRPRREGGTECILADARCGGTGAVDRPGVGQSPFPLKGFRAVAALLLFMAVGVSFWWLGHEQSRKTHAERPLAEHPATQPSVAPQALDHRPSGGVGEDIKTPGVAPQSSPAATAFPKPETPRQPEYPSSQAYLNKTIEERAQEGDAEAQCALAIKSGNEDRDFKAAFRWAQASAAQKNVGGILLLAELYLNGLGVQQDISKATALYQDAADLGSEIAKRNLSLLKNAAGGQNPDQAGQQEPDAAVKRNAASGDAVAQFEVAKWHLQQSDFPKAYEWMLKAAHGTNVDAMSNLGTMYYAGLGVEKNDEAALEWWRKAAAAGDIAAQNNLAVFSIRMAAGEPAFTGNQSQTDEFRRKAEAGDADAQFAIAVLHLRKKEFREGLDWMMRAVNQGHTDAMCELGSMYYAGVAVTPDTDKAVEWWEKAQKAGSSLAKHNLDVFRAQQRPQQPK